MQLERYGLQDARNRHCRFNDHVTLGGPSLPLHLEFGFVEIKNTTGCPTLCDFQRVGDHNC